MQIKFILQEIKSKRHAFLGNFGIDQHLPVVIRKSMVFYLLVNRTYVAGQINDLIFAAPSQINI